MSKFVKVLSWGALVLSMGSGCFLGKGGSGSGSVDPNKARFVKFYNCTHPGDATSPPGGNSFDIWVQVDGGAPVFKASANTIPDPWTDCHDAPHEGAAVTLDLTEKPGQWNIQAVKIPRPDELPCDSSGPGKGCETRPFSFHTDISVTEPVKLDLTNVGR